jgi:hypothetical protein
LDDIYQAAVVLDVEGGPLSGLSPIWDAVAEIPELIQGVRKIAARFDDHTEGIEEESGECCHCHGEWPCEYAILAADLEALI